MHRPKTALFAIGLVAPTLASAQPKYQIEALPVLEQAPGCANNSNALALNEAGDVIGITESSYKTGPFCRYEAHAVIWRRGELIDLGGIPPHEDWGGSGKGINDNGDAAVGWASVELADGGGTAGAFLWTEAGGMEHLEDGDSFPNGEAWGVNNSHEVALTYKDKAYYWSRASGLVALAFADTPDSNSNAWEINNHGLVVGGVRRGDFAMHAFSYDATSGEMIDLNDPDTATWVHSVAYGVNDNGDIAGFSTNGDTNHDLPSLWYPGQPRIDLPVQTFGEGYVYGHAEHVNHHRDVVGTDISFLVESSIAWVAFEVEDDTAVRIALNDLLLPSVADEWELTSAFEINDKRQIVGIGLHNGQTRGFLMTPVVAWEMPPGPKTGARLPVESAP